MKTNYHTHTSFCDGENSAEEMVVAALNKNIDILGFSAHAIHPFSTIWHLDCREYGAYAAEIARLKEKYRSQIKILCGFEVDYLPPISFPDRDRYAQFDSEYLIGSVHYAASGAFCVDSGAEELMRGIKNYYGGSGKKLVIDYYESLRAMIHTCDFDIIGHIDVIRKQNECVRFFDECDIWYKREIEETAKEAAKKNLIVEINTGGIARNAIDDVYPSHDFLTLLKKYDVPVMINSDAHSARAIDHSFDRAAKSARDAGYTQLIWLLDGKRAFNPL